MSRTRPIWSQTGALSTTPVSIALPPDWWELKVEADTRSLVQLGSLQAAPAVASVAGISTLTSVGTPTGGTFVIDVFDDHGQVLATTSALTFDESAADVKTALAATNYLDSGDITAAGGALPTAITLTWAGTWTASVPMLVTRDSLTGGTNARTYISVTTQPKGNGGYGYLAASAQEVWTPDLRSTVGDRFLYIAAVTGTGTYFVSAYR